MNQLSEKFMIMKQLILVIAVFITITSAYAQKNENRDVAVFKTKQNGFYQDSILPAIENFNAEPQETGTYLSMDFSKMDFPTDPAKYTQVWHNAPLSQGLTGTCWCFATTSFMESEVKRLNNISVKLSEMYAVYWEYVARAEYFVAHRGEMTLGEGSEANGLTRIMKDHGLVPVSAYSGMLPGQRFHDHSKLFEEIKDYLNQVKSQNAWNKEVVVSTVKEILNHYMQEPPKSFNYQGQTYTPMTFMTDHCHINPQDYYCFMSTKSQTYHQKDKLEVPDNWWNNSEYYNIYLDEFRDLLINALESGYSVSVCGDVSEPGYDRYEEAGIIPDFDIPENYINADAREFRFNNKTTTDDHCIHFVGIYNDGTHYWFMIKDSSSSGFDGPHKGYRFMREDYVKLKILAAMLHKDGARKVLDQIIK